MVSVLAWAWASVCALAFALAFAWGRTQVLVVEHLQVVGAFAVPLVVGEDRPQTVPVVAGDHLVPAVEVDGVDVQIPGRRAVDARHRARAVAHV